MEKQQTSLPVHAPRRRDSVPSVPFEGVEPAAWSPQTRSVFARALFGFMALLLALVCFFVAGDEALKLASQRLLPDGPHAISPYLIALAGTVLLSFAVGQAMQLFHVGGDEREDARLWAELNAAERGARINALDNKAIWSFRAWMAAAFIAVAGLHTILWNPLFGSLLALQVEAIALMAGTVLIVAFGLHWSRVIRPRHAQDSSSDRWISTHRWILHAQVSTPGAALFLWIVGLAATATVVRGLMMPRPFLLGCALQGCLAAVILWSAVSVTIEAWHRRGRAPPVLRMLREQDHPLVFIGMLDFSGELPARARSRPWLAELRASYWVYGRWPWKTWFTVAAALSISRDARSGTFRLVIDALPPPRLRCSTGASWFTAKIVRPVPCTLACLKKLYTSKSMRSSEDTHHPRLSRSALQPHPPLANQGRRDYTQRPRPTFAIHEQFVRGVRA